MTHKTRDHRADKNDTVVIGAITVGGGRRLAVVFMVNTRTLTEPGTSLYT